MSDIILITIVAGLIIICIAILIFIRSPRKRRDSIIDYTSALNYLLAGEKQKAFEKLKEAVKNNTSNIDAYLKIGDILRDGGYVEKAIKIHRGLTVRNELSIIERIGILKSLIKDYRVAKKYDKALSTCQSLLDITRNELWVRELQLSLYEEKEDWDKAFDIRKQILKQQAIKDDELLALYKVQAGLYLIKNEKEKDGRIHFRDAIKLDKSCAPAYLYLSDSYIRVKRLSDALNELKKFIERVPNLAYLAFDKIKDVLFEEGNFGVIESIYNDLLIKNPEIFYIRSALADIYAKKGEIDKAIDLCEKELELNPDSKIAKQYLVKYYAKKDEKEKVTELALELIEDSINSESTFTCRSCQNVSNQPYWHCPECKEWRSYLLD